MRRLPKREGFTLLEIMIAMVIVGVLATIAVSVFWRAKGRGYEATIQSDLRLAALHQEKYFENNGTYAADVALLPGFSLSPGVAIDVTHADNSGWAGVGEHPSHSDRECGVYIGAVPAGSAGPATAEGIVECGDR